MVQHNQNSSVGFWVAGFFFLKEEEVSEWNFDFFGTFFSFFLEGAA